MNLDTLIDLALAEDLRGGKDLTSEATISEESNSTAEFVARKDGVVSGIAVAAAVLKKVGLTEILALVKEGDHVHKGQTLIRVSGSTRKILLAERTALNFLTHLSGIATTTSIWVKELVGSNCKVRDTRKTTPGLRDLEKQAVASGGGTNHRLGLSDAILIKDNHIQAAGGITAAVNKVKPLGLEIEVEVDNLEQLKELIPLNPDLVLLDNFEPVDCIKAAALVNNAFKLEASGGITLENAKAYAVTGVDYIAVGALTHSAPAFDIGLDFKEGK